MNNYKQLKYARQFYGKQNEIVKYFLLSFVIILRGEASRFFVVCPTGGAVVKIMLHMSHAVSHCFYPVVLNYFL